MIAKVMRINIRFTNAGSSYQRSAQKQSSELVLSSRDMASKSSTDLVISLCALQVRCTFSMMHKKLADIQGNCQSLPVMYDFNIFQCDIHKQRMSS